MDYKPYFIQFMKVQSVRMLFFQFITMVKTGCLYFQSSKKLEEERLLNEVEKLKNMEDSLKEKETILAQRFSTEVEKYVDRMYVMSWLT